MLPSTWTAPMAPVIHKPCVGRIASTERAPDVARDASVGICVAEGEASCGSV